MNIRNFVGLAVMGAWMVAASGCASSTASQEDAMTSGSASTEDSEAQLLAQFKASEPYKAFMAQREGICPTPKAESLHLRQSNGNQSGTGLYLLNASCDESAHLFAIGTIDWMSGRNDTVKLQTASAAANQSIQNGVDTELSSSNSDIDAPKTFVDDADVTAKVLARIKATDAYKTFKSESGNCSVNDEVVPVSTTNGTGGGQSVYLTVITRNCAEGRNEPDDFIVQIGKQEWLGDDIKVGILQTDLDAVLHAADET